MKIAWLDFSFLEFSIPHINEMAREHEVLALLPDNQLGELRISLSPRLIYRGFYKPRFRQPLAQIKMIRTILGELKKFSPDVIHIQQGHMYFNWVLSRLKRFPLVVTIHDPRHHPGDKSSQKTPQWIMDFGFRLADRVIVHGSELTEVIHREIGFPQEKIQVIPHIALELPDTEIDYNCVHPAALVQPGNNQTDELQPEHSNGQQVARSATGELRILFFGRIWEYKGLEYLIRTQPLINESFPNAKFVIGGQGDDFEKYRALMVDPTRFEVHNRWIDNNERAKLFTGADVVVLPYIEATQSGVVPIAYGHRKPVIATRVGGLPDVVENGITGLLIAPRDVEQLAAAIIELLSDPERRRQMGMAGRKKLDQECSPAVVVSQTIDVYRRAIQDHCQKIPVPK
jgi:glycosyltransferase involved in cell wall biosynthesis